MAIQFDFATAGRILFGEGQTGSAVAAAVEFGARIAVVSGASGHRAKPLVQALHAADILVTPYAVDSEPTVDWVRQSAMAARASGCDAVIAIGGGSAIDAGKALAALLTNPGDPLDYLEVIGRGQPLTRPSAPLIAIPTTTGTGSEVTRNAVLGSPEHGVKASLRGAGMLPRLAIVDPANTFDLPRALTASTGMDALTQLIEPYVSPRANAMTDLYCVDGISRAAIALPRAWEESDGGARTEMCWASLLGGLALANAGLGAVHGFAAPLGGMFAAPHGAVCAALLPHAMEINIEALRRRMPKSAALSRHDQIARLLTRQPHAIADDGVVWIADLCARFEIPGLRSYGVTEDAISDIAEKAAKSNSMKGNPVELTGDELREIVLRAL